MKKSTFYFGILILALTLITSCSSDDDSSSENGDTEELSGTWGTEWNNAVNPKFTFDSNNNVKYYTYPNGNQPELEEIGTYNLNGDILVMEFPATVLIKFKNRVIFVSDTELNFEEIQESGFDTWSAQTYKKTDDPNL